MAGSRFHRLAIGRPESERLARVTRQWKVHEGLRRTIALPINRPQRGRAADGHDFDPLPPGHLLVYPGRERLLSACAKVFSIAPRRFPEPQPPREAHRPLIDSSGARADEEPAADTEN